MADETATPVMDLPRCGEPIEWYGTTVSCARPKGHAAAVGCAHEWGCSECEGMGCRQCAPWGFPVADGQGPA